MTPTRTPEGKWQLYSVSTGELKSAWPVDARGMLASGEFTATPPDDSETASAADAATVSATSQPVLPPALPPHPLGMPSVATHSRDAGPGQPFAAPVRTSSRKQGRR